MTRIDELKGAIQDMREGMEFAPDEAIKAEFRKAIENAEKELAALEKEPPKPKVVKKGRPKKTVSVKPKATGSKRGRPKTKTAPYVSLYGKAIMEATGCTESECEEVEDIMRNVIFHSTLDWQDKQEFNRGAKEAYAVLKGVENYVEPKENPVEACKKILQEANYTVTEKTMVKDGKKRTVKKREKRQDRTIIKDRTEQVFTTITKEVLASEEKKAEFKPVIDMAEKLKEVFTTILQAIDKLVANNEVDKLKKIYDLLKDIA